MSTNLVMESTSIEKDTITMSAAMRYAAARASAGLPYCVSLKERGNAEHASRNWRAALDLYRQCVAAVDALTLVTTDEQRSARKLVRTCLANLGAVFLKLGEADNVLAAGERFCSSCDDDGDETVDPLLPKMLYRMAMATTMKGDDAGALSLLVRCDAIAPGDPAVRGLINAATGPTKKAAPPSALCSGFGSADITPPLGAPMMGQLVAYENTGAESALSALAMVLCDSGSGVHAVFICLDVLFLSSADAARARGAVAAAINASAADAAASTAERRRIECDAACVIVSATHTHSGAATMALFGQAGLPEFVEIMHAGIVCAAVEAWSNACPSGATPQSSRLRWGEGRCDGLSFNRRFVMADGGIETHPLTADPLIVAAEGPDGGVLHCLRCEAPLAASPSARSGPAATATAAASTRLRGAALFFGCHATTMPVRFVLRVREALRLLSLQRSLTILRPWHRPRD